MHLLYNKSTGAILGRFICPLHLLSAHIQNLPEWQGAIEHMDEIDESMYYFDLVNTIRPRPLIEAEPNRSIVLADLVDSITISGLPIPCTLSIDDVKYLVDDGEFEFSTDVLGIYKITCEAWPYISKSWEIEAI